MRYAIIGEGGIVEQTGGCSAADFHLQGGDKLAVEAPEYVRDTSHYLHGLEFRPLPPKPGVWARWNGTAWFDPRTTAQKIAATIAEMDGVRIQRDRLLAASDWTDTLSAKARLSPEVFEAWQIYRQALRDMPETTTDPASPVWPASPDQG